MPPVSRCFALFKHSVRGTSSNYSRLAYKYTPPLSIFDIHIRTRLLGRGGILPNTAQVLRAFGDLSVPDGWKVLYLDRTLSSEVEGSYGSRYSVTC